MLDRRLCTEDSRAPRTGAPRGRLGVPTGPPLACSHSTGLCHCSCPCQAPTSAGASLTHRFRAELPGLEPSQLVTGRLTAGKPLIPGPRGPGLAVCTVTVPLAGWGQDGMNVELRAVLPAWCPPLLFSPLCLSQRLCLHAHDHSSRGTWASEAPPQLASSSRCSEPPGGFSRQRVDSRGRLHGSAELRSGQPRAQWVMVLSAGGGGGTLGPLVPPLVLNDSIALFSLVSEGVTLFPPHHPPPRPASTPCLLRCCMFSPQTK